MNWKRAKAIGKLLLLFGTPTIVVVGLFGTGVYCGNQHRVGITSFEKEWLGVDVEVAPPLPGEEDPDDEKKSDEDEKKSDEKKSDDEKDEKKSDEDEKKSDEEKDAEPAPKPEPKPEVQPEPEPEVQPTPVPPPEAVVPQMKVDPVEGALATQLATPVTVGVKVLVDDALVENRPDWIDYVQRTVSRASSVYEKQFGIELELVSVGRWGVATEGMSSEDLLADVHARSREAASIVVGFTERPFDNTTRGKAFTPTEDDPFNASAAVVYAEPAHRDAHLRTLLHEMGHLFGALDIADARHPDYQSGSWMSYAPVPQERAPWIDAANRARILGRKSKPFAAAPSPAPPEDDAPPPAEAQPEEGGSDE